MNSKDKTSKTKASHRAQSKPMRSSAKSPSTSAPKPSSADTNKNKIKSKTQTPVEAQNVSAKDLLEKSIDELVVVEDKDSKEMSTTRIAIDTHDLVERVAEQETDVDGEGKSSCLLDPSVAEKLTSIKKIDEKEVADKKVDLTPLPAGWEEHTDQSGRYFWHVATGIIQRTRPTSDVPPRKSSIVLYHDDEEINQVTQKTSSDDDEFYESGAALTVDDTSESTFIVYPLGSCTFDETQLISATGSKAIQKCILRLSNKPTPDECFCWGLDQSQPVLMKLYDDYIQFTDLKTQTLLRSQPIKTIKTWAVDEDNNFAFVIEDRAQPPQVGESIEASSYYESVDFALLSEPTLMCYVFRSDDDDNMSCKVAAKLNEEINRYKEHMSDLMTRSTRLQQMIDQPIDDQTIEADEDFDEQLEASSELTMNVKYIGKTQVPRPTGIDVLNVAIDKCLADASKAAQHRQQSNIESLLDDEIDVQVLSSGEAKSAMNEINVPAPALIEAKLHVSPSSVIVENFLTGEIIVECRIRFLTFIGISKRDIRWCGFIMQNVTNKTFVAHCFECYPTAGHVCEAIQTSCTRMFEKVVKNNSRQPETLSVIPTRSKIRNTLAKTFSRIKLNPIRSSN